MDESLNGLIFFLVVISFKSKNIILNVFLIYYRLVDDIKTVYDVRQILKRFGTYIYTGERLGDLELMKSEIRELHQANFITLSEFQHSILILRKEKRSILLKKDEKNEKNNTRN